VQDGVYTLDCLVESSLFLDVFNDHVFPFVRGPDDVFREILALVLRANSSSNLEASIDKLLCDIYI
jgi:hypothetical protein